MMIALVALARVVEQRLRTSSRLQRAGRKLVAGLARRSKSARAFVQLRLMRLV